MKRSIQDVPQITISCQIRPNQPFSGDIHIIKKMIDSVIGGGARSVRLNGSEFIEYTKEKFPTVFIIGIKKIINETTPSSGWITPDIESAQEIINSNPDMIVLDGSAALHTLESLKTLINQIRASSEILIGCDIGTEDEAIRAIESGADIVLTTLVQAGTRENKTRDDHLELVKKLIDRKIPVIAEGGIVTEEQTKEFLLLGVTSVVIGKAIVDPGFNTKRFVSVIDDVQREQLIHLFKQHFLEPPTVIIALTPHGSDRNYYKMESPNHVALGTIGSDKKEDIAFIKLAKHLGNANISVPKVYGFSQDYLCYVQEFSGIEDLFAIIKNASQKDYFSILKPAIDLLYDFQTKGTEGWNFDESYPFPAFDTKEMVRDFERFKKRFLSNLGVTYGDTDVDTERDTVIALINTIPENELVLMHRDFQSRNILNKDGEYVLIDFQGARKGPIHYDLASLLYQSQMDYSPELKNSLIDYYLSKYPSLEKEYFLKNFYFVTIARLMQSIGSYGIAGLEGKKEYFLKSIPFALSNLKEVLSIIESKYDIQFPHLKKAVVLATEKCKSMTL